MEKMLPECPVETTLMLISDRWKVLIIRDLLDGTKRFGELKICWKCIAKGFDGKSAFHGRERPAYPKSVRGSAAAGGIYPDGNRV